MSLLAIAVLLACIVNLMLKCSYERIEARGAWNLIVDYDRTRGHLNALNTADTAAYLEVTVHAKLDGTNRDLNNIMERERAQMVQDLLTDLRNKTGENLGSDPEKWIKKYYKSAASSPAFQ